MGQWRFGIDLGGTKTELIALDATGQEQRRERIATDSSTYAGIIDGIVGLVQRAERDLGGQGTVGVGIPGAVDPTNGLIKNANTTILIGKPFDQDLAAALDRPVRLENDANCLAVSEATDGAGAGAAMVFAIILGTGVGGGLALNGRAWRGANAIAGEWGHNPLPWPRDDERPGRTCYCRKQGCIETFLSGPGLAADHGGGLTGRQVAEAARQGDETARAALDRYIDRLARATAHIINMIDPDVLVLGGGVSLVPDLYEKVPLLWPQYVFGGKAPSTRLVPARHGDSSGVRGAAWLWPAVSL